MFKFVAYFTIALIFLFLIFLFYVEFFKKYKKNINEKTKKLIKMEWKFALIFNNILVALLIIIFILFIFEQKKL